MKYSNLLALLPLAYAAPSPREAPSGGALQCVIQQYVGPFTDVGFDGYIHLYANVTTYDTETQITGFNETRLGLADGGTLQNCGDCRSSQQFAFEVCEGPGPERYGFDGLGNGPRVFHGHILYTTDRTTIQCLTATQPFNGSSLTVSDCQYDYDNAGASGQYFQLSIGDEGQAMAALESSGTGDSFRPNPEIAEGGKLIVWSGPPDAPFTYLGFKANEI